MAADTALKRYSAMNISSPWRGLNVFPQAVSDNLERAAVMYLYAAEAEVPGTGTVNNVDNILAGQPRFGSGGPTIGMGF